MSTIVVTGGSGSLGTALTPLLLEDNSVERIRIVSRGEHRQMEMSRKFNNSKLEFIVGDVRDHQRMMEVVEGSDVIFHLAAYKSVDTAEIHDEEAIKTNFLGTQNVVKAAKFHGVEKMLFISTDKAVSPINCYGQTKALAESLVIRANRRGFSTKRVPKFSVARYGNVFGSNGSVLVLWKNGSAKLTEESMTRFFISIKDAAQFVYRCYKEMQGGEVFIPKMKSTTMIELLEAVKGSREYEWIGKRPGEKIHESLVSSEEAEYVTDDEWCLIRWPISNLFPVSRRGTTSSLKSLSSDQAPRFSQEELKSMVQEWEATL